MKVFFLCIGLILIKLDIFNLKTKEKEARERITPKMSNHFGYQFGYLNDLLSQIWEKIPALVVHRFNI